MASGAATVGCFWCVFDLFRKVFRDEKKQKNREGSGCEWSNSAPRVPQPRTLAPATARGASVINLPVHAPHNITHTLCPQQTFSRCECATTATASPPSATYKTRSSRQGRSSTPSIEKKRPRLSGRTPSMGWSGSSLKPTPSVSIARRVTSASCAGVVSTMPGATSIGASGSGAAAEARAVAVLLLLAFAAARRRRARAAGGGGGGAAADDVAGRRAECCSVAPARQGGAACRDNIVV